MSGNTRQVLSDGKPAMQLGNVPASLGTVYARVRVVSQGKNGNAHIVTVQGYQVDASGKELLAAPPRTVTIYLALLAAGKINLQATRQKAVADSLSDIASVLTYKAGLAAIPDELIS